MPKEKVVLGVGINEFLGRLIAMPDLRDRVVLGLLFETGCSMNELCSVRVNDFMPAKDYEKLNRMRFIDRNAVISETLSIEIKKYILFRKRTGEDYLFSQKIGKPLSTKRVEQIVAITFNGKITPMQIRYMHVVHAASKGLSPDTISEQTGLSRQRILQILDAFDVTYKQSYSLFFEEYGGKNEKELWRGKHSSRPEKWREK